MPPTVARLDDDTSGAKRRPCGLSAAFRSLRPPAYFRASLTADSRRLLSLVKLHSRLGVGPAAQVRPAGPASAAPRPVASHAAAPATGLTAAEQTQMVKQYCATCHSDRGKAGGLSLASFDAANLLEHTPVADAEISLGSTADADWAYAKSWLRPEMSGAPD